MSRSKYMLIRTIFRFEIVKIYKRDGHFITELIGCADNIATAKRMLYELKETDNE